MDKRPIYKRAKADKKMNKQNIILGILIVAIIVTAVVLIPNSDQPIDKPEYTAPEGYQKVVPQNSYRTASGTTQPTSVVSQGSPTITRVTDYSTLKQNLLANEMIQDLPKSAKINLKFYNFDSGQRQWEKSFVLGKSSVEEGTEAGDIQIVLSYKYVTEFRTKDFCTIIAESKASNDYAQYTDLSTTQLLWKFKSMLKYRDCLGV